MLFALNAAPMCFSKEAKELCCPTACKVRQDPHRWPEANQRLRECLRSVGCHDDTATVSGKCEC